jgi:hypothetical protein
VFSHLRPFKAEDDCTLGIALSYSITLVSENFDPPFLPCYLGLIFFRSMHLIFLSFWMQLFVAALLIKLEAAGNLSSAENNIFGGFLIFILFAGPLAVAIQIGRSAGFCKPKVPSHATAEKQMASQLSLSGDLDKGVRAPNKDDNVGNAVPSNKRVSREPRSPSIDALPTRRDQLSSDRNLVP